MSRTKSQANAFKRSTASHKSPIALDEPALAVWDTTLSSVTSDHFALADLRVLALYCRACTVLDTLHEQISDNPAGDLQVLRAYKDLTATVTGLAAKLRLTPSSRNVRRNGSVDPLPGGGYGDGFFGADDGDYLGGG